MRQLLRAKKMFTITSEKLVIYYEHMFEDSKLLAEPWFSRSSISKEMITENVISALDTYRANKDNLMNELILDYFSNISMTEVPPPNSLDAAELLLSHGERPEEMSEDTWRKVNTSLQAILNIFTQSCDSVMSLDFIKELHLILGRNVGSSYAGHYRNKRMFSAGVPSRMLAIPEQIEIRLAVLVEVLNKKLFELPSDPVERILRVLKIGTVFFSEFLLIEPFFNENEQIAKLLLSYILKDVVSFPFPLLYRNRSTYLEVMVNRYDHNPPDELITYALMACNQAAVRINNYLITYGRNIA